MAVASGIGRSPVDIELGDEEHPVEPVRRADLEDAEVGAAPLLRVDVTKDEFIAKPLGGRLISDSALAAFAYVICAEVRAAREATVDAVLPSDSSPTDLHDVHGGGPSVTKAPNGNGERPPIIILLVGVR